MYQEYGWAGRNEDSSRFGLYNAVIKFIDEKAECILDMGCGRGDIANQLIDAGFHVYGVDGSAEGVEIANQVHAGHFFVMDFESDALPDQLEELSVDTIISLDVIEHLYSPKRYIELCNNVLPGGGY